MWRNYAAKELSDEPPTGIQQSDHNASSGRTQPQPWTHERKGTTPTPLLSFYGDQYPVPTSSAHIVSQSYFNVSPGGAQYTQQAGMPFHALTRWTGQMIGPSPQTYPGHSYSTPLSQLVQAGSILPPAANYSSSSLPVEAGNNRSAQIHLSRSSIPSVLTVSNPVSAAQNMRGLEHRPKVQFSQSAALNYQSTTQGETPSQNITAADTWAPSLIVPNSQVATHAPPDHISSSQVCGSQHLQPHTLGLTHFPIQRQSHVWSPTPPAAMASHQYHSDPLLDVTRKAIINQCFPQVAYGDFMQTHHVKNVQVFSDNSNSKMLVEDWICDI